jgi:carbon monoxide dehydrogenase subunit G
MARYVTTVSTPLSPAEAFAFMADVTRFAEWDPGVKHAARVRGDGPGFGTIYELTVDAGTTSVMRYATTEFQAPRRFVLVAKTAFLTSIDEVRVEASPTGARVTYDAKLTLNGPLSWFDSLLARAFERIGDKAAAGLRTALKGVAG